MDNYRIYSLNRKKCLSSSNFSFQDQHLQQISFTPVESFLLPVLQTYLWKVLKWVTWVFSIQVEVWQRYIDDTFIIWSYIHFTMELECNQCLPFLDVLVSSQPSGRLGHLVHQKLTHADRYFHPSSHHHQTQKIFVINSLVQRVITLLEQTNLDQEICQE